MGAGGTDACSGAHAWPGAPVGHRGSDAGRKAVDDELRGVDQQSAVRGVSVTVGAAVGEGVGDLGWSTDPSIASRAGVPQRRSQGACAS